MPRQITVKRSEVVPISKVHQQEIDAIKQRLDTAKEQATAASKSLNASKEAKNNAHTNMELAKKMLGSANKIMSNATKNVEISQSHYDISQKELKEAEKYLAESEQKLKVSNPAAIGKQSAPDLQRDDNASNKKRKVLDLPQVSNTRSNLPNSLSTTATSRKNTTKSSSGEIQVDTVAIAQPNNIGTRESSAAIGKTNDTGKRVEDGPATSSMTNNCDHILAESCGNVELNGMYKRVSGVFHCGAPVYTKKGNWKFENGKGYEVIFTIFREGLGGKEGRWYITYFTTPGVTKSSGFKTSIERAIFKSQPSDIVPENGWVVIGSKRGGIDPGPFCKLIVKAEVKKERDEDEREEEDGTSSSTQTDEKKKRKKFTEEEDGAIHLGVERFGAGGWAEIKGYYSTELIDRTTINLKNRWRTLNK